MVTAPTHNAVNNVMRKYLDETAKEGLLGGANRLPLRVSTDVNAYSLRTCLILTSLGS